MGAMERIYVLGAGAVGFPLATFLAQAGRGVVAVRTSREDVARGTSRLRCIMGQGASARRLRRCRYRGWPLLRERSW